MGVIERMATPVVFDEMGVAGLFDVTDGELPVELRGFSLKVQVTLTVLTFIRDQKLLKPLLNPLDQFWHPNNKSFPFS